MINQLWRDILRLRSQYLLTPHGHIDSTSEHKRILEALCMQDRKMVHELVQIHCEHSKSTLLGIDSGRRSLPEDPALASDRSRPGQIQDAVDPAGQVIATKLEHG
jgi:hypothetical protein